MDAAIPTDSSLSSQSLPLPLDNAVNNTELLTRRIGKNLRYFQGQAVFFLLRGCLLNIALWHGTLKYQNEPVPFSVVQS